MHRYESTDTNEIDNSSCFNKAKKKPCVYDDTLKKCFLFFFKIPQIAKQNHLEKKIIDGHALYYYSAGITTN